MSGNILFVVKYKYEYFKLFHVIEFVVSWPYVGAHLGLGLVLIIITMCLFIKTETIELRGANVSYRRPLEFDDGE